LGEVVVAEDDRGGAAVAGDCHPVVLMLDPVDDFTEVVTDLTQRLGTHGTIVAQAPASTSRSRSPPAPLRRLSGALLGPSSGAAADVASVVDAEHDHFVQALIDSIQDSLGAATRGVDPGQITANRFPAR
jgi:hypothetical protein